MKQKNKDKDRARYRGWAKVQLQGFLEAVVHNVKRMIAVNCSPLMVSEVEPLFCEA